ncbi:POU domain, class 4, transcription factor 3 [Ornithorhynchus anatinus]|uniref:POU domain protein n=1 Tax=Ornithorhynchus anatinus TaxID=9258 RepID=F7CAM2_ORNAN|nr:POU domain, class 4, transcription factor 3 [Ornithorhynchus anatinus]
MNAKQPYPLHPCLQEPKLPSLPPGTEAMRRACLPAPQLPASLFAGFDDSLLARAEALATADLAPCHAKGHPFKPDATYHPLGGVMPCGPAHPHAPHPTLDGDHLLDHLPPAALGVGGLGGPDPTGHPHGLGVLGGPGGLGPLRPGLGMGPGLAEVDQDPRELEAFAERFKQRRIKLGVTQADVGAALATLKIPGVGSLSQSTICRFESLTLSHNNMTALRPVLQAWLEEAEAAQRDRLDRAELSGAAEKKRKRTSIAAPEKRSLEAYFALQPRPSSEKIAAIADKLDLKKNVVRVWFCNQRQKQKRMKYAAAR